MVIVRAEGNIGPFKTIETLADRLRCDGVDYPFIVIGDYTLSDDDSLAPVVPPPEPTEDERKMTGVEILGVMCSATKEDQSGLSAVALGVTLARMSNQTFPATRFEFENGNSLIITNDNFDAVYAAWVPFRQSFFAVE
jgi:hypothetical protein